MFKHQKTVQMLSLAIIIAMISVLTACGGNSNNGGKETPPTGTPDAASATNSAPASASDTPPDNVTLRFFSNLPDRKSGQGLAEQTVIDRYMSENPNIKIEVEALAEEPFKNKLKVYMASNEPIDVTVVNSGSLLSTLVQANYVLELNPSDYASEQYSFLPGVFKSFTFNDKLYGLPRNSDYEVIYYNKALFAENNVSIPTTTKELLEAAKTFRSKNIEPMSINGKDLWILGTFYQNVVQRVSGSQSLILDAVDGKVKFTEDPSFLEAANVLKEFKDAKLFISSYMTSDYGASQNLFTQGRAAMWYMGSWEAGMASNEKLSEEFRNNLGVFKFPVIEGGKGKDTDVLARNGGGFSVISASKHPEESKEFFDYLMQANQWSKTVWDTGAAVPAQKYELNGNETDIQVQLTDILLQATSTAGASFIDYSSPAFKENSQNAFGKFFAGSTTPEQLVKDLQAAADKQ
jgi:raffinose/stachyose/melibiose transport system substrate-binding protein